ncbi:MAG: GPP34 family phosphoprotein [Phycisphaerae bacterium]|nr:GPP34 family phosphoprotein [Phycisphaerae bacterium]
MRPDNNLFLHEEILLLALKDEEGTIASCARYNYAVGGAILAELLLGQRIAVDPSKKKRVSVVNSGPLGDPLIDEWLAKIAAAKRPKSLQDWVYRIANTKDLKHRIALPLCQRGILKVEEKSILLLFTQRVYPQIRAEPERRILDRLHQAIFTDAESIDPRTIVLLSLAKSADLLSALFGRKAVKPRKARIERLVGGEIAGKATRDAIQAVDSAVMIACIMPVVTTS